MHQHLLSFVLLLACATLLFAAIPEHRITNLPGLSEADLANFELYSGYITVDTSSNRNLFYWFVRSNSGSPQNDPVTLWLNGGPGCSSLGGMFSENGPFKPAFDGRTLLVNPYSWNNFSNMIYLEAPAGVGFSYSDNPDDYNTDDKKTAQDNYDFLLKFFQNYPEYSKNDFYVAGESYAGHYVPTLSQKIYEGNQAGNAFINLKGYAVGNGVTDDQYDGIGVYETFYSHALIPLATFDAINKLCRNLDNPSSQCQSILDLANNQIGDIDPYNIYEQVCPNDPVLSNQVAKRLVENHKVLSRHKKNKNASSSANRNAPIDLFSAAVPQPLPDDPCIDVHVTTYLQQEAVKKAIHAKTDIKWSICTDKINYAFSSQSMVPIYQNFLDNVSNFKILKYSGDVDTVVPYLGTAGWIDAALKKGTTLQDWTSWTTISTSDPVNLKQQVAGYYTLYQGLNQSSVFYFVTVKGAGHMVPLYKPAQAFHMYYSFLKGSKL